MYIIHSSLLLSNSSVEYRATVSQLSVDTVVSVASKFCFYERQGVTSAIPN